MNNSVADRENLYDTWHESQAATETLVNEPIHPWHLTVAKLLPALGKSRVLEIGCGRGDFANWLAGQYPEAQITGVDFSEAAISTARERSEEGGNQVAFRVNNAEELIFADCSIDYVISCECLEHVFSPERMAREIFRVLRPGGRFILTTENYFNGLLLGWLKCWLQDQPFNSGSGVQPHENFFVFWKVKKILERGGLVVDHMESNHFQWLLLPRTDPKKLMTRDFSHWFLKKAFRPFGRHFTFCGRRPLVKK